MLKNILKILLVFAFGAAGGIWAQAFLLPYLAEEPHFQNFQFVRNFKEREIVVNPKEEIIIQENTALRKMAEKVKAGVVGIKSETSAGKTLEGSGLIVTSDGLVITLTDIVPKDSKISLFLDEKELSPEILQRNPPFLLLKIEGANLPTIGFSNPEKLSLGERVFLVGIIFRPGENKQKLPQKIVNEGIIKYYNQDLIQTNIFEKYYLWGSSLFDMEGNLVGITAIDEEGKVAAIPSSKVKEFLGF